MTNTKRLDVWLWRSRFYRTRLLAQRACLNGQIRINSRRVVKCHHLLREGDFLTLLQGKRIRVVQIVAMPERRGPASEAQKCYEDVVFNDSTQQSEGVSLFYPLR